ncbi:AAI domain-containing protein [Heracleum sosnowskyi]|uniref:AAI domain-containing protein n=1 Tax=Heracleum sosnowskyi TaxID=360622 RepID=A0AAD8I1M2_9APIA|nr:AAI domain-containing protein [Heracleum sosnowskyi]
MKSLIVAVVMVAMLANLVVQGQDGLPDIPDLPKFPACVVNLLGCADSLNTTTTPPDTCCLPLKEAITDQLPCLCSLYNNPTLLISLGINITQVIELPARCGINFSITECTGSPAPVSPMPYPGSPTTPSAATPPSDAGHTAATATFSRLFILAAAMLYWT